MGFNFRYNQMMNELETTKTPSLYGVLFAGLKEMFTTLYQYAEHRDELELATRDFAAKLEEIAKKVEDKSGQ